MTLHFYTSRIQTLLLALALSLFCAGAHAQSNDNGDGGNNAPEPEEPRDLSDDDGNDPTDPAFLPKPSFEENPAAATLNDARRFCRGLTDESYRIDCLAERLRAAADAMPADPQMAEARTALRRAAADLQRTVAQYRDTAKPPVRARRGGTTPIQTARPLVAVRTQDLAVAKAQARRILDETETVLLRAADRSAERALSYQQIAAAVGSNKVLLRS